MTARRTPLHHVRKFLLLSLFFFFFSKPKSLTRRDFHHATETFFSLLAFHSQAVLQTFFSASRIVNAGKLTLKQPQWIVVWTIDLIHGQECTRTRYTRILPYFHVFLDLLVITLLILGCVRG